MKYTAKVIWKRKPGEEFTDKKYSRAHKWSFDGGIDIPASSSPQVVRVPLSDETAVDPEEALVASASSCHMLTFLAIAARSKFVVEIYEDNAEGLMQKNEKGKMAITNITLRPSIIFLGPNLPSSKEIEEMHMQAHDECFIANSVKADIEVIAL